MAIFSVFTGFIYNEAFSIPLAVFGNSAFTCPSDPSLSLIDIRTNEATCPEAYTTGLVQVHSSAPGAVHSLNLHLNVCQTDRIFQST